MCEECLSLLTRDLRLDLESFRGPYTPRLFQEGLGFSAKLIEFQHWIEPEFIGESWGIAFHDLDRDGYLDFYANHHARRPGELIMNLGGPAPDHVRFDVPGDVHGATFFDIDQDGEVDLLQSTGGDRGEAMDPDDSRRFNKVHLNEDGVLSTENSVVDFGLQDGLGRGRLMIPVNFDGEQIAIYDANVAREDGASPGQFYRLGPSGRYTEFDPGPSPIEGEFSKGVHFDDDRFVDIVNINQGTLSVYENAGTGLDSGTVLDTGVTDIAVGDFNGDLHNEVIATYRGGMDSLFYKDVAGRWSGETTSDRPFETVTSIVPGDFDNDGRLDYALLQRGPGVHVFIYKNMGKGNFEIAGEFMDRTIDGRSEYMIVGDVNRDGALDLAVSTAFGSLIQGRYVLLEGRAPTGNWLSIELRGVESETGGLGAQVYVATPRGRVQMLEQDSATHIWSQNAQDLHFGLGVARSAEVRVVWPDGYTQVFDRLSANQHVVLTESRDSRFSDFEHGSNMADALVGSGRDDLMYGNGGPDRLQGGRGDDALFGGAGKDRLFGGRGDDVLSGGPGKDRMTGGPGADTFMFESASDAGPGRKRDVITDFRSGKDKIDLADIDADSSRSGDQAFDFIGSDDFTGARGELRYANGVLRADMDGDGRSDFAIKVRGAPNLTTEDLLL